MALPNKEELVLIAEFREKVAEVLTEEEVNDDMFLIRWLRARDYNISKAEDLLRNAIKWRKAKKLLAESVSYEEKLNYFNNFPSWHDGQDKDGRPVYIATLGKWNISNIGKGTLTKEGFQSYLTLGFENILAEIQKAEMLSPSEPVTQYTAVLDWKDFAWSQILSFQNVQNWLQVGGIYESIYPEILHKCYFINSPALISTVLATIKPVVGDKTLGKITCFGSDRKTWDKEVLSLVPEEGMPYSIKIPKM